MKRGTLSGSHPIRFLHTGLGKTSEVGVNYNPNAWPKKLNLFILPC